MKIGNVVSLEIRGFAIPGKKNSKMIVRPKKGRPMLITKPEIQKLEKRMVESIVSQLRLASQTGAGATSTAAQRLHWMLSSLPQDDCWTKVKELNLKAVMTPKGREGCNIEIERIR